MRSLSWVVSRLMILGLCIVVFAYPVSAGKDDKTVKDEKTTQTEKVLKTDKVETKETPKGNVAVVNGVAISQDDFDREIMGIEEQSASRGEKLDDARLGEIRKRILEKLIEKSPDSREAELAKKKIADISKKSGPKK